jgi:hypothetical protein
VNPDKKRKKASKFELEGVDEAVLRGSVENLYVTEDWVPTVEFLLRKLEADINFQLSINHRQSKRTWRVSDRYERLVMVAVEVSEGRHLIIIDAGGENGFVPNALLVWNLSHATGNYDHQMNQDNYERWMKENLTPNYPPYRVLVLDNAPCHNVKLTEVPNSDATENK